MSSKYRLPERKTVVYTTKAKCRDCYRCVRVCPVHAIKMENEQAQVITENCITCGTCVIECPQHAKTYATEYGKVLQMLEGNHTMIISVAPSFAGYYNEWEQKRLPSALRTLGFHYITETAVGAWHTAQASFQYIKNHKGQNHICTACPAIVNYINIYEPQYSSSLIPISSPMIGHARMMKRDYPKAKFVFVGPCIAKKDEALQANNDNIVDAVLTFEELDELFKLKDIHLDSCEESRFDQEATANARLFPLEGGLLKTAGESTDILDNHIVAISGFSEIKEILHALKKDGNKKLIIEPLFCRFGCVNGPIGDKTKNIFTKRESILEFASQSQVEVNDEQKDVSDLLKTNFPHKHLKEKTYTEEQIKEVLAAIGKYTPEDELNCMACGYDSCREKAIAVLEGLAELNMCMPFMRRVSEQKFDTLIKYNPSGIVTLNQKLEILHMNDAFKKIFTCSDAILGKNIAYLIDPDPFEKLTTTDIDIFRENIHYVNYNITAHVIIYRIPNQEQYVGIFMDVTAFQNNKELLSDIKSETLSKAQELLDHQVSMAQELARFLGEHTAKEEVLLNRLIDLTKK